MEFCTRKMTKKNLYYNKMELVYKIAWNSFVIASIMASLSALIVIATAANGIRNALDYNSTTV